MFLHKIFSFFSSYCLCLFSSENSLSFCKLSSRQSPRVPTSRCVDAGGAQPLGQGRGPSACGGGDASPGIPGAPAPATGPSPATPRRGGSPLVASASRGGSPSVTSVISGGRNTGPGAAVGDSCLPLVCQSRVAASTPASLWGVDVLSLGARK